MRRLLFQVRLVTDMVDARLAPDAYTFAAILNACQRTDEADLAFDLLRFPSPPSCVLLLLLVV